MSTRKQSSLFLHINTSPNPDANPTLWEHRLRQRRPLSRNPFEPESTYSRGSYGLTARESPPGTPTRRQSSKYEDDGKLGYNVADEKIMPERTFSSTKNLDLEWGDQVPGWLNLFFDLAWTATFSSLTSNAKFKEPWDSVSYIAFFTTAWWLWVSQVFYNVEFYTDDWFHLVFIFLQLLLFGALAATTQGFDITNYILHSPGSDNLETYDIETITPERYAAERLAKISVRVIMLAISISRAMLLIQHLRVAIYAKLTSKSKKYPLRLFIVPASLVVSATLFFVAFRVTMSGYGRTPAGSKVKMALWGVALLVEMVAHIVRFQMEIDEGINAIAGTFFAIEKAPGFSGPTATGIVCCGGIVFFLAYLYFNGAAPLKSVRRHIAWVMMHLPWLLSVILLLEGVKNQLLLQSYMSSNEYMINKIADSMAADVPMDQFNATMRPIMLQGGMSYNDEYATLMRMVETNMSATTTNVTDEQYASITTEITGVWYLRVQMKGTLNTYITYMDNDSIPDTTQEKIQKYLSDYKYTLEDFHTALATQSEIPHFAEAVGELVSPSLNNARYIMAVCGATFITLASLNLIQSWPRDRFQWASIISRYIMGLIMILLLLLNVGKVQGFVEAASAPESHIAGYLKWVDSGWVLPTLALSYLVQFIVDTTLVYLAVWYSRKSFQPVGQDDRR
ncbi:low temperature requirement protein LtrA [Ceratobasidium sp. AG-Ba]|nr:low temperature requirement protein LtrA [Ceratobasidium sp. AG-Ba]